MHRTSGFPHFPSLILLLACLLMQPPGALADTTADRPRIGLALSGGGARGAAHIGVIRELERLNIPVDYIAGTSMGAIIGGLFASGMNADQIEQAFLSIDWDDVLNDKPPRRELSMRRKFEQEIFQADKSAGVDRQGLKVPSGLIRGQKLELVLNDLLLHAVGVDDFDQLPIPFRAVATDIVTSEMVVMGKGSLPHALRASMAVPGVFTPVKMDGHLLVDGGISNNLPIDVVREMGADIVIAVNIGTPLLKEDEVSNVVDIAAQLTSIMVSRTTKEQIKTLHDSDILITPELNGFSSGNFKQAHSLIPLGSLAVKKQETRLAVLSHTDDMDVKSGGNELAHADIPIVDYIDIDNDSKIDDSYLLERLQQQVGQPLDLARLEADIGRIYGLDIFDSVQYRLEKRGDETGLKLIVRRKPWGPNYLQFGLSLSSDLINENNLLLRFGLTRMPINHLNGEWRNILYLGREPGIETELYQPLAVGSPWFGAARAFMLNNRFNINENDKIIAETSVNRFGGSLAFGREFGSIGDARLGYRRYYGDTSIAVGDPELETDDANGGEVYAQLRLDTLDSIFFPRHGAKSNLSFLFSRDGLGADNDFDQAHFGIIGASSWGKHTLQAGISVAGTFNGEAPIQNFYRLGGLFDLPGYTDNELSGQNFVLLRTGYLREIGDILSLKSYLGGTLQYGNIVNDLGDMQFKDLQLAGAIYVGLDSVLGPIYLGYGVAESGNNGLYLRVGGLF